MNNSSRLIRLTIALKQLEGRTAGAPVGAESLLQVYRLPIPRASEDFTFEDIYFQAATAGA